KGFSLYTAHDAVEPTGQPYTYRTVLDAAGQPGPRHAIMRRLLAFLQDHERDLLAAAPPVQGKSLVPQNTPRVGFAFYYPNFRFPPSDFLPGLNQPDPARVLALNLGVFGIYAALLAAGYEPLLQMINLETARPEDLAACAAVVMPNKGALTPDTHQMLLSYAK